MPPGNRQHAARIVGVKQGHERPPTPGEYLRGTCLLGVADLALFADRPDNLLSTGCDHDLVAIQEFEWAALEVRDPMLHAR